MATSMTSTNTVVQRSFGLGDMRGAASMLALRSCIMSSLGRSTKCEDVACAWFSGLVGEDASEPLVLFAASRLQGNSPALW